METEQLLTSNNLLNSSSVFNEYTFINNQLTTSLYLQDDGYLIPDDNNNNISYQKSP